MFVTQLSDFSISFEKIISANHTARRIFQQTISGYCTSIHGERFRTMKTTHALWVLSVGLACLCVFSEDEGEIRTSRRRPTAAMSIQGIVSPSAADKMPVVKVQISPVQDAASLVAKISGKDGL